MSGGSSLGPSHVNSVPTTPSVELRKKFEYCEETFLNDEEGWREEAEGVIRDVDKYVKLVCVSKTLASSSNNVYLNLITKEEKHFTIELTSQGFKVVGLALDSLDLVNTQQTIYETPYSLLDNISPAYRQAFGEDLTSQLLKLQSQQQQQQLLQAGQRPHEEDN